MLAGIVWGLKLIGIPYFCTSSRPQFISPFTSRLFISYTLSTKSLMAWSKCMVRWLGPRMFNMTILHVPPTLLNIIPHNSANDQVYAQFNTFGVHPLKIRYERLYLCSWEHLQIGSHCPSRIFYCAPSSKYDTVITFGIHLNSIFKIWKKNQTMLL